jgi:hypothetical protein
MNNEQKRRRTRGDVNALFDVIELSCCWPYSGAQQLLDAALIEPWFWCFPYYRNLTRFLQCSFEHEDESIALKGLH